jgi:hypothetical protein
MLKWENSCLTGMGNFQQPENHLALHLQRTKQVAIMCASLKFAIHNEMK